MKMKIAMAICAAVVDHLSDAAVIQVAGLPALQEVAVDGTLSAETTAALRLKIPTVTLTE